MIDVKPTIFVSHASTDKELAELLAEQIRLMFGKNRVSVFVSSEPNAIDVGDKWFSTVIRNLQAAKALVVLITPVSVDRRWVWFEIGYFWPKTEANEGRIYPLYVPQINEIPHPLSELQAKSLGDPEQIRFSFERLREQFGFGNVENVDLAAIVAKAEKKRRIPTAKYIRY